MTFDAASAGEFSLPLLDVSKDTLAARQARWRDDLVRELYGPFPNTPCSVRVDRAPIANEPTAERLRLSIETDSGVYGVDAAIWLPPDADRPAPLICGLDFVGPAGIMPTAGFPLDEHARIFSRSEFGASGGRLSETLRGTSAHRWPVSLLHAAGCAVMVSCYGSWIPDDPGGWQGCGFYRAMSPDPMSGALSLWARSVSLLVDAAEGIAEVDASRVLVAGHSRLGKAALWAAANDARISTVFASNSGTAGAAPYRHRVGETLAELRAAFPHWLSPAAVACPSVDQHMLLASIAPRAVYLAGARDDIWADPVGSYCALRAAAPAWGVGEGWPSCREMWSGGGQVVRGSVGCHLRDGGHEMLPFDWARALEFASAL